MSQRGFTLIELMIALAIFALISAFAYRALDQLFLVQQRVRAEAARWDDVQRTLNRIERDFRLLLPRSAVSESGEREPALYFVARGNTLALSRAGLAGADGALAAPQRIAYRLSGTTLELLRWPHIDRAPRSDPVLAPLLTDVASVDYRFLGSRGEWHGEWPARGASGEATLPRAVEVRIRLKDAGTLTRQFALAIAP
jgi:general secretion pathway protein J